MKVMVQTDGVMKLKELTDQLEQSNKLDYELGKLIAWSNFLNNNKQPVKWYPANSEGTDISYNKLNSPSEHFSALKELKAYMDKLNSKYNLDLQLQRK